MSKHIASFLLGLLIGCIVLFFIVVLPLRRENVVMRSTLRYVAARVPANSGVIMREAADYDSPVFVSPTSRPDLWFVKREPESRPW